MAAAIIVHTNAGAPIGAAAAQAGVPGLTWGIYEMTSTENSDWIVLPEFKQIVFADCKLIATGALTDEPITIDATTANKLVFTGGATGTIRVLVFGQPSII